MGHKTCVIRDAFDDDDDDDTDNDDASEDGGLVP